MFKIIFRALLSTAAVIGGVGIIAYGTIAAFEYAVQIFGHFEPLAILAIVCTVIVFSGFVSYFRYCANYDS